ncbi:MAG: ComEC/Rec2 family competence protein, partial [Thermoleophilia bacterium]|nr:ComEC/Rec2 family competence protein [Thermoleophilia bacterium]
EAVITGPVRERDGWQEAAALVEGQKVWLEVPPESRSQKEAVSRVGGSSHASLEQGLRWHLWGTVRQPDDGSSSNFDQARYLRTLGITVVLRVESETVKIVGRRGGIAGWFDHLRAEARNHLSLGRKADLDEILQGVVMADKDGLDTRWLEAFRWSGTAHMLAVSGLHVGSLAGLVLAAARRLRLPRGLSFMAAGGAAVFMVPFTGGGPSVTRAATMICLVLAGRWLGRKRDQWQVLALAAVVVLAGNPWAVRSPSFQLSFAAVAGVFGLAQRLQRGLQRWLQRLPHAISSALAVSLAATAGTAPVSLAVFGQVSLVGAVANVLVVPLLPMVLGLGMASVFLGFVWHGLSACLDTVAAAPLAWILRVSQLFARFPVLSRESVWQVASGMAGVLAVIPAVLAVVGRPGRLRRWPGMRWVGARRPRNRAAARAVATVLLVGGLAFGLALPPLAGAVGRMWGDLTGRTAWPAAGEVRVFDVGQGNAVLVRTPDHHAVLIDAGPSGCNLAQKLKELQVRRLD